MQRFLLRRAAARSVFSQTSSFTSKPRTIVSATPSTLRSIPQCRRAVFQQRFASQDASSRPEASPVEAQTSGETVTTEPSRPEIEAKEETYAGRSEEPSMTEKVQDTVRDAASTVSETVSSAASAFTGGRRDSGRDSRGSRDFRDSRESRGVRDDRGSRDFRSPREPRDPNQQRPTPVPGKILYVGNLFFEVQEQDLQREFAKVGSLVNTRIVTDPKGDSKGFGYVEFETLEDATRAQETLNQKVLQGRRMSVQYHVRREPGAPREGFKASPPSKSLFIGNMSFQMSDKDLNELFRTVKNVIDVRVAIDRRTGQPRGFAHADFIDVPSAEEAKKVLESKEVYGRRLRVDFARQNSDRERTRE